MRITTLLATTLLTLTAVGCASRGNSAAKGEDFTRDLQLASATSMDLASPKVDPSLLTLENAPRRAPEPTRTARQAEGEQVVPAEEPTVAATPEPEPAAAQEPEPVATTSAPAPAPVETSEPVAVAPRPTPPAAIPAGGTGAGDYGRGGGVWGTGTGVVIRGGGVHGDNCELHRPGRGGTIIFSSPVYRPPGVGTPRIRSVTVLPSRAP